MIEPELPLLPLVLDGVPPTLVQTLAQAGVPFCRREIGGSHGRFVLFDSSQGPAQPFGYGQVAIDIDRLRQKADDDPFELLADGRSCAHRWEIAGWSFKEEAALVDRRIVRRRILDWLRAEIEQAGGIWLCVSPYPFPFRSAFALRIDHTQYDAVDFHAVLKTLGYWDHVTHFLCASAFEGHADDLVRLRGLDVGSQGYLPEIYSDESENRRNIQRGVEFLQAAGLDPRGFAAPGGRFHHALIEALDRLEIPFSSEYGYAYDDLPFFPEGFGVLQTPVHPVSLSSFLSASRSNATRTPAARQQAIQAAIEYFRTTARQKYHAGEPIFFRDQSSGALARYPQLFHAIRDTADAFSAVWKTTLYQFADWWMARSAVRLSVVREDDHFLVTSDGHPPDYRVGIEYRRGTHVARMRLKGHLLRFSPSALAYENCAAAPPLQPVRLDPPQRFRQHVARPAESDQHGIASPHWLRLWAKRALDRLRE